MIIGSKLIFCRDIDSTNTHALRLLQTESLGEGTIIYTNHQSSGRGQQGNKWVSEDGKNLLFSIVLFPDMIGPEEQFIISVFISLGICDFLEKHIPGCKIKWPNDIYAGNDKIAGILIENSITGKRITHSIAGIGLNVNQLIFPDFFPSPVSLKKLTGKDHDLDLCLKQISVCLDKRYKELLSGHYAELRNEYTSSLYRMGEWHDFNTGSGPLSGRIISVTDSGCLLIEDRRKHINEFKFKEVEFIP